MKLIIAVIRPHTLDRIVVALENIGSFPGITVADSEGFGQRLRTIFISQLNSFKPNKRIEIAAPDEMVEELIAVIRYAAKLERDKNDGQSLGVRQTPTIIVNGRRLVPLYEADLKKMFGLARGFALLAADALKLLNPRPFCRAVTDYIRAI